ncbi:MAG: hypothetical protein QOE33_125 [Acidobacteriota bacterium]|nr:hypothetical protein [Acidobacteriota bacterium]
MRSKPLANSIIQNSETWSRLTVICLRLIILVVFCLAGELSQVDAQDSGTSVPPRSNSGESARAPQTYTREGVSVEFSIEPISSEKGKPAQLLAGTDATVRFKIADANAGKAISNLHPIAWIDRREGQQPAGIRECREKVQSFLQPDFNKRPTIDLNTYYILALNREPSITIIDPLSGFAGSKLYALVPLNSSGEDWVLGNDKKRLYVSMPLSNQIAVIDTTTWKLITNVDAGPKPTRVALQHDGRYLWVGNDTAAAGEDGGVTVIDTVALKVAARIKTGAGHHEVAFADDDSLAFVTNRLDGTLSVVDVRKLSKATDVKVGSLPSSLAFSPLSKAVYVANEGDGTIVAVGGPRQEILAVMKAQPGLRAIRLTPDGRFGFAVNRATNTVYVFDVPSNRIVHTVPTGPGADQITFTRQFAYVRSTGDEFVTMIKLGDLGKEAAVTRFPAGQRAPKESPADALADAIVPAPEDGSVLVANPADQMIYYYTEGMAAPMGSFQNYRRDPKALLVLDNNLRESERGVYSTTVRLAVSGHYDVAFLLDSPRLVNCFDIAIAENPALPKQAGVAIKVEPLAAEASAHVGERYNLRFKVTDSTSNQPKPNLEDVGVLVFLAPGIWQQRDWAKHIGGGIYEVSFVPPDGGVYYVFFQCPSLGVRLNQITPLTIQATKR